VDGLFIRVVERGWDVEFLIAELGAEGAGAVEDDWLGGLGLEGAGIDALAAASFVCKFCTLRVNDSTLVASFLFSFNILYELYVS